MAEDKNKLFAEFPSVTTEEWEAKINVDLKGADYERALVWRTNEKFNVRPYYREEDLKEVAYLNSLPGQFPYVRGTKEKSNDWYIRQDITVKNTAEANKKALDILNKGITSLGFVFESCEEVSVADIETLLEGVAVECIEVNFKACCKSGALAKNFITYLDNKGIDPKAVKASINVDPLSCYMLTGKFCNGAEKAFEGPKELIEASAKYCGLKTVAVNGKKFVDAGSSISQELGFSLAMGAEYMNQLTEAGVSAFQAAANIKFNFGVGPNYFMEIAKLRAGRMLWAKIVDAYKPQCECGSECSCEGKCKGDSCKCVAKMSIHSENTIWNKTVYDPYTNLLRTQTEAMSAALGGSDSITVTPFNSIFEESTDFSERIARNQQIMLKEESHFDKIVDPAAGSYYIENLTNELAKQAWNMFLTIQDKGGFVAALKDGYIQNEVKEMTDKRDLAVARRRENLLGVNQFPNFTEFMETEFAAETFKSIDRTAEGAEIETLKSYRGAQAFEALRFATDSYSKNNKRPLAFMLTVGNLTMRKARAQFSCNFFAIAGFNVIEGAGFKTIEEGMAAAKEAGADIIVVCSSDDEYSTFGPQAYEQRDGKIIVIAGAPKCADELKAAGITNFVNVRSNALEELAGYQKELGI